MAPVEPASAIEEIRALKARYCRALDSKDAALWRSVFADDLVADMSEAMGKPSAVPPVHGADIFVSNTLAILAEVVTVHQVSAAEIQITGPDSARAVWAMEDRLWVEKASDHLPYRRLHGWGHYHETYRRDADGWRIASLKLTRIRVETA